MHTGNGLKFLVTRLSLCNLNSGQLIGAYDEVYEELLIVLRLSVKVEYEFCGLMMREYKSYCLILILEISIIKIFP
jgi:hypothetical protein